MVRPFARRARDREPVGGEPVGGVGVGRESRRAIAALSHRHGGLERPHGLLHGRGDHVARAGQLPAHAGRGFADPAGGTAPRAPGTLGRLARRIVRRLGRGHLPDVFPFRPAQRPAELPGQLLAHVAGAGPDQPALEFGGQVAARVTTATRVTAGLTGGITTRLTGRITARLASRITARVTAGLTAAAGAATVGSGAVAGVGILWLRAHSALPMVSARDLSPFSAVSTIVFSARRLSIPGIGTLMLTASS